MAKLVVMPKLGLTMTEGAVSRWLKAEGEAVREGEPLFEVETDKLTNTIEATASGTLLKILAKEGETLPCLAGVAVIGEAGEDISPLLPGAPEAGPAPGPEAAAPKPAPAPKPPAGRVVASPAAKKLARELGVELAEVPGTGPGGRITEEGGVQKVQGCAAPAARRARPQGQPARRQGRGRARPRAEGRPTQGRAHPRRRHPRRRIQGPRAGSPAA